MSSQESSRAVSVPAQDIRNAKRPYSSENTPDETDDSHVPLKAAKLQGQNDEDEPQGLSVGFPELRTEEDNHNSRANDDDDVADEGDDERGAVNDDAVLVYESKSSASDVSSGSNSGSGSSSPGSLDEIGLDSDVFEKAVGGSGKDVVSPHPESVSEPVDLEKIELINLREVPMTEQLRHDARAYLKTENYGKFLSKFIPEDFTAEDVLLATKLLGYVPKNFEDYFEETDSKSKLEKCIILLQKAINKVLSIRQKLQEYHTIEQICAKIKEAENIIVLTGAGISTSLGIPDFRSSQGFYSRMKNLGLDDPQDVFSLEVFRDDPSIFYSIAHMILPPDDSFTPLHGFIKLLQDKGKLLRNYTQNIDNLESNAGVLPDKMIRCHGSFASASCITCKFQVPGEVLFPNLRRQEIAYCPFCESDRKELMEKFQQAEDSGTGYSRRFEDINSFGVMKPDITFFGEDLPQKYHDTIKEDLKKCDLLLCIGTSLKVAPVSEIVNMLDPRVPQVLINRDLITHAEFDIEFLGFCDQVITYLCGKLGWEIAHKDFQKLLNSGLQVQVDSDQSSTYTITTTEEREKAEEAKREKEQQLNEGDGESDKVAKEKINSQDITESEKQDEELESSKTPTVTI